MKPVIVTAGKGFTDAGGVFHPWGQELTVSEGPELEQLIADEKVRFDDRQPRQASTPAQSA